MAEWDRPGARVVFELKPLDLEQIINMRRPSQWPALFFGPKIANMVQDFVRTVLQGRYIDDLKKNLELMTGSGLEVATEQAAAGPEGDAAALKDDIIRFYGGFYDNWKSGIGVGMGGAFSSAMDDLINAGQMVYAFKTLAYHTAITPRLQRHWNKTFTPMEPSSSMAMILYRRGKWTFDQYKTHAAYDGWSSENAELIYEAMQDLPTPREAFYLWMKGQIDEAKRNSLYFAHGLEAEWWTKQTENWYYVPTLYDLTRIADYVELDQIWALDAMRRRGVKDADRAKIWEMLEIRPLRDEIRALTGKWTWRYKYGRTTLDNLTNQLILLKVRPKERDLLIKKAKLDYEDELIDEWIEILRWRFRTAAPLPGGSEESFRDELIKLGINEEKANLIVEGEKAKGYYGYY